VIYCVVPQALASELLDRLSDYYSDDPNVEVMVDRRALGGLPGEHAPAKDRRRQRPTGSFPPIDLPANG
jgi:hypothetical protein